MSRRRPAFRSDVDRREVTLLVVIGVVTILLWHSPYGAYLLYPFSILATWFHEMGHGLAAMAFGNQFERLVIFPDGSGYALYYSAKQQSRVAMATIAAAGLLGPTVAGCLLILASRTRRSTQFALFALGVALLASTFIWVRSTTGWVVLPSIGAVLLIVALKGSSAHKRLAVQFLGVQGCVSIYRDFGYLFSEGGNLGGQQQLSDTGYIERALLLPYWFWGVVITALIAIMVYCALRRVHLR